MVALGIFGAMTKLKSAANDLPYSSQVALGLFGQCNAQASKVAPSILIVQELCESRGGRPGLSVLTSLLASVDVKLY